MPADNYIPLLLINLDRRPDRLDIMKARLKGIPFHRIPAVDGAALDEEFITNFLSPTFRSESSRNEVGCVLSHRATWQWIVDHNSPVTCILEDDIYLSPDFSDFIRNSDWLPGSCDLVKIETMQHRVWLARAKTEALGRTLHELRSTHAGAAGYIVSLFGAGRLLEISTQPDRVADDLIFEISNSPPHTMKLYQLSPALCIQEKILFDNTDDSDLETERRCVRKKPKIKWHSKLWREAKRPFLQLSRIIGRKHEKSMAIKYK